MEQLKNLPEEFVQPFLPCFGLLKNCNILFFDDRTLFRRILPYFYILPSVVAYHTALTICFIQSFKQGMDLDEMMFVVPVYVVCSQTNMCKVPNQKISRFKISADMKTYLTCFSLAFLKAAIMVSNKKEIRSIILRLGALWRTQELSEVQINKKNILLKRLKFCYAVFYWLNMIGSLQYMIAPILETIVRRYILQQECGLLLPFRCYFPFDPTANWGVYLLVYFFEGYSMFRIVYCYLGSEFLMIIILCSHLGTEFTLLQEDLLQLQPSKRRKISNSNDLEECANGFDDKSGLTVLIRRHQILIGLSQDLDNILNKMVFVNLFSASFSICFFGFSAKVARDAVSVVNNFVAVLALMLPIFNLCYYGELLKEASEGIAGAAYTNLWYKGSKSYKKAMWLIMKRSQKPCGITSLKYNPVTLGTFTTVMSTTWSYFSLASSLYDETAAN